MSPRRVDGFLVVAAVGAVACGGSGTQQPMWAAGSEKDDGHGMLARASAKLMTGSGAELEGLPPRPRRDEATIGGDQYGGAGTGGDGAYGGASYASYVPPTWSYPNVDRVPPYIQRSGLTAAIEGTITWRGPRPRLTTACGVIEPLRVGAERGLGGVLVYIERVSVGRVIPHANGEQRPTTVGGIVVKRGCAFAPATQIVTPIPAALAIHGDARPARVRITRPAGAGARGAAPSVELAEGGRVALQAQPGVTRIESEDGSLGAAWVLGLETPAYAITDDLGRFRIDELAAGRYEVTIWQPPIPTVVAGKLVYGTPVIVKRWVQVSAGRLARLDVALGR